jgi:conjugal transfer ATP-binding protein TraC
LRCITAFIFADEKTLKMRLLAKCSQVENQANSPLAKWIPSLKREADEWQYVRQQFEKGQRLVKTQFQVLLFGETAKIHNAEQQLLNIFRANCWELAQETLDSIAKLYQLSSLKLGRRRISRSSLITKSKNNAFS